MKTIISQLAWISVFASGFLCGIRSESARALLISIIAFILVNMLFSVIGKALIVYFHKDLKKI